MAKIKHTPGDWRAILYKADADGRPHWGVRQSPDAPSVSVAGEILPCSFSICEIVEQDMGDIENGEEAANAKILALALTAPHECDDPHCPGNINRRKLEAFDELKEAAKNGLQYLEVLFASSDKLLRGAGDFETVEAAKATMKRDIAVICVAIAKAEEG